MKQNQDSEPNDEMVQDDVLRVLLEYTKGGKSIRSILRNYQTSTRSNKISKIHFLSLNIVRYLNTIDFIVSRSLDNGRLRNLPSRVLNLLRIAIYKKHFLQISEEHIFALQPVDDFQLKSILKRAFRMNLERQIEHLPRIQRVSLKLSHPTFLVETLESNMGYTETIKLLEGNNQNPPIYFRPNNLLVTKDQFEKIIETLEIDIEQDSTLDDIFKLKDTVSDLILSEAFQENHLLIQDKASIFTVKALNPKPGDIVWDACAAPGMKTQLIWEMMQQKGRLTATELNYQRLKIAQERSHQLGMKDVLWLRGDAATCPITSANKILIDAPCSSTGMIRSHPSYKWRLNKKTLFSIMAIQNKILEGIVSHYQERPGTQIVYATCSILPHEGESQIDTILNKYDIELLPIDEIGSSGYQNFECSERVRRLFPHMHDTDGFFIAKMRIRR